VTESPQEPSVALERRPSFEGRRPYASPRLEKLGDVRSNILGNSPGGVESGSLTTHRRL